MTNTIWKSAGSDDWSNAADWSLGLPTSPLDAVINATGASYTVTVSSNDSAHDLFVDSANATLSESATGRLTMSGGLTLDSGTVILNGTNSFGAMTQLVGGTLEIGKGTSLGTANLMIDGGALIGLSSLTISNTLNASGRFTLAAAHGSSLRPRLLRPRQPRTPTPSISVRQPQRMLRRNLASRICTTGIRATRLHSRTMRRTRCIRTAPCSIISCTICLPTDMRGWLKRCFDTAC